MRRTDHFLVFAFARSSRNLTQRSAAGTDARTVYGLTIGEGSETRQTSAAACTVTLHVVGLQLCTVLMYCVPV